MNNELSYKFIQPEESIADFVESFWMIENLSHRDREVVVLPDGRIDLFFTKSAKEPFHVTLIGIETQPDQATISPGRLTFAISFKPIAAEYLFPKQIANLLDTAQNLPPGFWDFQDADLNGFELFCKKASEKIHSLIPPEIDTRKRKLFDLIHQSHGEMSVKELASQAFWSSRQINRYFNQQLGLSLKTYCNILRFRASFHHIKEGSLFPQQKFTDQSHFIREVKKMSGVSPKELSKNQNGRFVQFSTLDGQ